MLNTMHCRIHGSMALMVSMLASLLMAPLSLPVAGQRSGYTINPESASSYLIASPEVHVDSRKEPVYEEHNPKDENGEEPAHFDGTYVRPVPVTIPIPKYPKSLKRSLSDASVTFFAIVAHDGTLIDIELPAGLDSDVAKAVMSTAAKYRFRPATLDGQPIAMRIRTVIAFRIR